MSDELHKELAALAAKLGVSVEHLWGVLVRQAYIDGLSSLVTVFFCAAAGAGNNFYWVITDFFNPEFYALRHLPFQQ
jgi:hypothetical protein